MYHADDHDELSTGVVRSCYQYSGHIYYHTCCYCTDQHHHYHAACIINIITLRSHLLDKKVIQML